MAITPATSGTFNFAPSIGNVLFEAFDRISVRPSQVDRHMMFSARDSMNTLFIEWEDDGFCLWRLTSGTLNLVAGQASYTVPMSTVQVTEVWYSQVNGNGAGVNLDRIMTPLTRTQYAMLPNKLEQGIPTQFWFEMLAQPVLTLWQVPTVGQVAPAYVVNWYGIQQMEDATLAPAELPNVVRRAIPALYAGMAEKLAEKFAPTRLAEKQALYQAAYGRMQKRDQELGPTLLQPNVGIYSRLR